MYIKKLFILLFLVGVIFSECKGSAGGHDLCLEDLELEGGYESNCDSKDGSSEELSTPILEKEQDEKVAKLLAQVDERFRQSQLVWKNKKTPLTFAAVKGNVESVRSLLADRADVNQKDGEGRTALMDAALRVCADNDDYQAVIRCLLDERADVNLVDNEGRTALMLALKPHFGEGVIRLFIAAQADVTREDNQGVTVLEYAADCSNNVIDLLAQAYVGPDQASNERWQVQVEDAREKRRQFFERLKAMEHLGLE